MKEMHDKIIDEINEVMVTADVEEPAGRGAGWRIEYDEDLMRRVLETIFPPGFRWINKPVTVRGEDFTYEATCLCSFPKTSGKIRYIVEDHGRIFVQREEQLTFHTSLQQRMQKEGEIEEAARQRFLGGCPHCGYHHPPDGMCLDTNKS